MFRLEMSEFIVKGPSLAFLAPDSPRGVGNFPDNKGNKYAMREGVGNSLITGIGKNVVYCSPPRSGDSTAASINQKEIPVRVRTNSQ